MLVLHAVCSDGDVGRFWLVEADGGGRRHKFQLTRVSEVSCAGIRRREMPRILYTPVYIQPKYCGLYRLAVLGRAPIPPRTNLVTNFEFHAVRQESPPFG